MLIILFGVILLGWVSVAVLGTMAYFLGEQSKPIHERNWRAASFERLSESITNRKINYAERIPAFTIDS